MPPGNVIIRFDEVTFGYDHDRPLLEAASFSVRENSKVTIMGQNGAGKSTMFKLISREAKPAAGQVHIPVGTTIAQAHQVMPAASREKTITEFFARAFTEKPYNLPKRIKDILAVVHLEVAPEKSVKHCSGGQQARLLLAYALIQEPDILLLDEPTNNLDSEGIDHLTQFLMAYPKTVIVISHDAAFLNCFTHGVLYLDSYTHKVEQYLGDYYDVLSEIEARIERERAKNAQLKRSIQDRKDKINFFAHKGGKMRALASKLRDQVAEAEDTMVEERQEDKTINDFTISAQADLEAALVEITSIGVVKNHKLVRKDISPSLVVRKKEKLLLKGPNGIGKSSLLQALASGEESGAIIKPGIRVGYYRQDFSGLDFTQTVYDALQGASADSANNQEIYATAAQFLLTAELLRNPVGSLSEGQKGLLCYAQFVLQKPGLLIMDEPTNHINFRHLPVIARALDAFTGAMILVSHAPEFVDQITVDQTLDLGKL